MNKLVLGLSLAAVLTVVLISSPVVADAITDLVQTTVHDNKAKYSKISFELGDDVPVNGEVFGGYAIFTDGHVIAVTSHKGAFDSETQLFDDETTTFALCSPEQLVQGLCGPEWHTHLVEPVSHNRCDFAAIGALTFEEPSSKLRIKANEILLQNTNKETSSFTNSITGTVQDFTVGQPVDADSTSVEFDGVAFDLNAAFNSSGNLVAICIGDTVDLEFSWNSSVLTSDGSTWILKYSGSGALPGETVQVVIRDSPTTFTTSTTIADANGDFNRTFGLTASAWPPGIYPTTTLANGQVITDTLILSE